MAHAQKCWSHEALGKLVTASKSKDLSVQLHVADLHVPGKHLPPVTATCTCWLSYLVQVMPLLQRFARTHTCWPHNCVGVKHCRVTNPVRYSPSIHVSQLQLLHIVLLYQDHDVVRSGIPMSSRRPGDMHRVSTMQELLCFLE